MVQVPRHPHHTVQFEKSGIVHQGIDGLPDPMPYQCCADQLHIRISEASAANKACEQAPAQLIRRLVRSEFVDKLVAGEEFTYRSIERLPSLREAIHIVTGSPPNPNYD